MDLKVFSKFQKSVAIILVLIFFTVPLFQINAMYSSTGIYFCGPVMCDPTPAHLSPFCHKFH